jgi:hypothetical protein
MIIEDRVTKIDEFAGAKSKKGLRKITQAFLAFDRLFFQKKANVRISILSRGGTLGGAVGSSKAQ